MKIEVYGFIKTWCSVEVEAPNLMTALEKANNMHVTDFIQYKGQAVDSSIKIVQVFDGSFDCSEDK